MMLAWIVGAPTLGGTGGRDDGERELAKDCPSAGRTAEPEGELYFIICASYIRCGRRILGLRHSQQAPCESPRTTCMT
jgi:hypothetical protein